jgi:hypothetical protein
LLIVDHLTLGEENGDRRLPLAGLRWPSLLLLLQLLQLLLLLLLLLLPLLL